MAERLSLPRVWWKQCLGDSQGPVSLRSVSATDVPDCGDDLRGHPETFAHLVSSYVVCDEPEVRGKCVGASARPGFGQLPDSVDLAP